MLPFGMPKCDLLFSPGLQNFINVLQLIKEAFFKHGDENILKTCIKVLSYATNESQGDLQDSANQVIKETADDLSVKLRSAITQTGVSILNRICLNILFGFLHSPTYR